MRMVWVGDCLNWLTASGAETDFDHCHRATSHHHVVLIRPLVQHLRYFRLFTQQLLIPSADIHQPSRLPYLPYPLCGWPYEDSWNSLDGAYRTRSAIYCEALILEQMFPFWQIHTGSMQTASWSKFSSMSSSTTIVANSQIHILQFGHFAILGDF